MITRTYAPILKGKQGELTALGKLHSTSFKKIFPIVELQKDWLISQYPEKFLKSGVVNIEIGIDFTHLENFHDVEILTLFEQLIVLRIKSIPCGFMQTLTDKQPLYSHLVSMCGGFLVIRLNLSEYLSQNIQTEVFETLRIVGGSPDKTIIILDAIDGVVDNVARTAKGFKQAVINLSSNGKLVWRTIVLASTSFPKNFEGMDYGHSIRPREDFFVFDEFIKRFPEFAPLITFGDYAIQYPSEMANDIDPRVLKIAANLRYTGNNDYHIIKGRDRQLKSAKIQIPEHCEYLMGLPDFNGLVHCYGDTWFSDLEKRAKSPGGPKEWRAAGINRHIELTVNQLATFDAPLGIV
jgi:hypothetical protein